MDRALRERGAAEGLRAVLVQRMVTGGVECLAGFTRTPSWGPLVGFGLGGIHVELLRDVHFRIAPLTDHDLHDLVRAPRAFRLLDGYRGAPPADVAALEDLLARLGELALACPRLQEADLNPVLALPTGQGALAVDARFRVG